MPKRGPDTKGAGPSSFPDEPLAGGDPVATDSPSKFRDRGELHDYWVHGEGLAKWANSPHPWTALHNELAKYIHDPIELDATTSKWHYEVFRQHTGSDAYRAEHGGRIRGKKIGPG